MSNFHPFDLPTFHRKFIGFDKFLDEMSRSMTANKTDNYPPCNIYRLDENSYVIEVAVAGFSDSELSVTATGRYLTISGSRDTVETPREYLHRGISGRGFSRQFTLDQDVEFGTATLKNGILTVTLRRVVPPEDQAKKIVIQNLT